MSPSSGPPPSPGTPESAAYPGRGFRLGEYVIVDTLGHGSMATVFLARDSTGHEVAIKIFQEGPGVSPTLMERFKREAEAAKKLRKHPNIMKVYATGREGPYHYIVMEPVRQSKTLEDLLESGQLGQKAVVQVIVKIARALHYAHTHNIIHRDVKPTNVMIDEFGEPLLADFGVAALIDWPSFTMSGALTGTPLYMSPEQARAERVGPASDVYSLGVVLFEALTGQLPYSTQHAAPVKSVLEAVKKEAPRRPRSVRRDVSPQLESVILKALEKDPAARYEDAEEFAADLERALAGSPVTARPYSSTSTHLRQLWSGRERVVAAFLVLLLAAGAGFAHLRNELLSERYERLLTTAHLRNFSVRLMNKPAEDAPALSKTPGAWHAIRMGRRSMTEENWTAAVAEFQTAVNFSEAANDPRTAAIARLDQARCETLLGNHVKAFSLYREIMGNADASPSLVDFAHAEALLLALLQDQRAEAVQLLNQRPLPASGPLRDLMQCLGGELAPDALSNRAALAPQRLRNDLRLAAAIRHRLDGREDAFAAELQNCVQSSSPPSEWPAPLARSLRRTIRR